MRTVLPESAEFLARTALFGFRIVEIRFGKLTAPIDQVFSDPDMRAKLRYLTVALRQMHKGLGADLFGALSLTIGFNALDGD